MKKLLVVLLISLGLHAQAQVSWCDSLTYTTLSGTQTLTTIGDASSLLNLADSVVWSWQACNATMCYSGSGDTASFTNILITDTVKICYDVFVYLDTITYTCTNCDSLVYDGFSYSWVLMNMGNPTSIKELIGGQMGAQMYDLLGREIFEIPIGVIYIKNGKKFVR